MSLHRRSCRRRQSGIALLDTLVGVFILTLAAAGIFSLLPVTTRAQELADDQTKATQIATRMIEHLQLLRPSDLTAETLDQLNLIDKGSAGNPFSFTKVALDHGSGYSPAKVLREANARFWVSTTPTGAAQIDIQIDYRSASGKMATYQTGTILGSYR